MQKPISLNKNHKKKKSTRRCRKPWSKNYIKISVSVNKNIQGPKSILRSSTFVTEMPAIRTRQQEPFPALYPDIVCAFLCKSPSPDCSVTKNTANLRRQTNKTKQNSHTKCKNNQPTPNLVSHSTTYMALEGKSCTPLRIRQGMSTDYFSCSTQLQHWIKTVCQNCCC